MALFPGALIMTLALLATDAKCDELVDKEWWETALVYQIWPRGFQDSDGNGEGDLQGIISRFDYLEELGIDAIWLNPIYASPLVDSGFDISNYTDVNPLFGSFEDFDELVEEAHKRDLKVILDIVPNHSSDEHKWFLLSVENVEPYTNYYVWSNGSVDENGNNIPPNNWMSTYSDAKGSAWTWHDTRKQWYYHKFHRCQPDLNLRNENVTQELLNVFDFWLKRGIDGFRIDAVSYLFEDENLTDEPDEGKGMYTSGLSENIALIYTFRSYIDRWVETNNSTSKLLIAESHDSDEVLVKLYGNDTCEGIPPFNFQFMDCVKNTSNAEYIRTVVENWFKILPKNARTNWVISNHDNSRVATRSGLNRVDGLHMLSLLLPGQAYTYYGDEIAMLDRQMSWKETIDPMGCARSHKMYAKYSRDSARTPMQWNSSTSAGFSTNTTTYLPVHPNYVDRNVEAQQKGNSNLNTYKLLAALRKDIVFTHGHHALINLNNGVLILKRFLEDHPIYIVAFNVGLREENINLTSLFPNLKDSMDAIITSSNAVNIMNTISGGNLKLTANAAVVLRAYVIEEESTTSSTESNTESSTESSTENGATTDSTVEDATSSIETTTITTSTTRKPNNNSAANSLSALYLITSATLAVILLSKH